MIEKEYIEREEAYKACEKYFNGVCGYDVSESEVINDFEKIIDSVPTADVAPVRHGRWEELDEEGCYSCSVCGNPWIIIDGTPQDNEMYFCPHYGAKMDGGEGE